ncbi:hypothetical protein [Mycobacterium deserti]|uniref:Uncharacterized protein n=1 Tax=Mycobacterium deserti TaxID=2978347 RepID=A0ABT2M5R2_9MYCO|nr:hypothetical protein [Mycobacterium deserti]MCT7657599.1 hypothetical protein [Mycobacterium deserti]
MDGFRGAAVPGPQPRPSRTSGHNAAVRWFYGLLLIVIGIAAVAGIISTASMGQTPVAIAIGIVALAFFSRVGC